MIKEKKIESEINDIITRYAPDPRTCICNIKVKSGKEGEIILVGETSVLKVKQSLIKALDNDGIRLIDSILILPDTTINKKYMGLVTLSVINLRKEPEHSSELVSQAIMGTPVLILNRAGSWFLVQTPDNYVSWTEESSIRSMSKLEMEAWKKSSRVLYCENTGWIYANASTGSGIVGDLVGGCIMEKSGKMNGFNMVVLPDSREGFVEEQKLVDFDKWKDTVRCNEGTVCSTALTFMGLPYLWGGTSAKGVDCSGFVHSVFFMNGVVLERDASLQALHGLNIDISGGFGNIRKGDLLFFGSGVDAISHVGIYLGNDEYINSSGRVMINSLDSTRVNYSSYRKNSLLTVKRIIGVDGDIGIVPVNRHSWY
jgi:hypothetical protein